jgi:hypothetical protein
LIKQSTGTGIGRALRAARLRRGKSLEEASRETRVKTEYLNALELERFEVLLGDVYVRGFLRSYARYLGLNPEKVVGAYQRMYGKRPQPAPVHRAPGVAVESVIDPPERHRRTAWLLAAAAATILLISAGAVGLISRSTDAPPPPQPGATVAGPVVPGAVQVDIEAEASVGAVIIVDGDPSLGFNGLLDAGEVHSFKGEKEISVHFESGYAVKVSVNGKSLGKPGLPGHAYDNTFTPDPQG